MAPEISVIIPIFNSGKYLEDCLKSVIGQDIVDIEIICVDDGSTDDSLKILEEYALMDRRLSIIKQNNIGPGAARNAGIKAAHGEFIAFMDSDDWYPDNWVLKKLYSKAKENEVQICGGSVIYSNGLVKDAFLHDGMIQYSEYQYDYGFTRYIYDRMLLINNNLFFPDYRRFEDPPFFCESNDLCRCILRIVR